MKETNKFSHLKMARIAGVLYLVIFIVYPLSAFIGKSSIIVAGDPSATVQNIQASQTMFRIGIAGEALIFLVEIIMAGILYELLKPVNTAISLAAAFSRLAEAVIQAVNLLPSILVLILVSGAGYLSEFDSGQTNALVSLFMESFNYMIIVWGFFFGLHLVLLGYLVNKSNYFPGILGVLLIFGGVGYLLQSFGAFVVPQFDTLLANVVLVLAVPSELAFTLYLLVKGIKKPESKLVKSGIAVS